MSACKKRATPVPPTQAPKAAWKSSAKRTQFKLQTQYA
jgi:hypothetical protein